MSGRQKATLKAALKPWLANNYEAHLEYYTPQGGVLSVGGFIKDISNVQVQQTELLADDSLTSGATHDPHGRIKTLTDANGHTQSFEYDGIGRMVASWMPSSSGRARITWTRLRLARSST